MNKHPIIGLVLAVTALAGIAIAGVDRGGITFGVADRSAGLGVDDVEFDVSNALVISDGNLVGVNELAEGQFVTVYGPVNADGTSGEATTIIFDDSVDGPIEWIDWYADDGLFGSLGQLVRVTQDTVFAESISSASIHGLHEGMHVEVSGIRIKKDEIQATYIKVQPDGSMLEVTGFAENVDSDKQTFSINDLIVSYRHAQIVSFLDGHPDNDNLVEVRGLTFTKDDELRAIYLEKKPILTGKPGDQLLLNGLVSNFETQSSVFLVAGTPVYITNETDFDGGNANSLGDSVRVQLDGHWDNDGVLRADNIEFNP